MLKRISFLFLLFSLSFFVTAQAPIKSSSKILADMHKLKFVGNVLYIAAHPDDENTRLISWLDNQVMARTAYLSLTRGDGGQNLIGTEKGAAMGVLRTQELLEARKIDGGEQFFSRAVDFGYSKSADETLEFWDKEAVLGDVVWVIRKFRPDVIITRFPPDKRAGHGHHTASAMLAIEAFNMAGDPKMFVDQLKWVETWQPKRILWNTSVWWDKSIPEKAANSEEYTMVSIGDYDPLLGTSYPEIAAESRSQHKSQGFGASKTRGERKEYLQHLDGEYVNGDLFSGVTTTWERIPKAKGIATKIDEIIQSFNPSQPENSISALVALYKQMSRTSEDPLVNHKMEEVKQIIAACAGIYAEAIANDPNTTEGQGSKANFSIINRSKSMVEITALNVDAADFQKESLAYNQEMKYAFSTPKFSENNQPYWLKAPYNALYKVDEQNVIGLPENLPVFSVGYTLNIEGQAFDFEVPLEYKWTDRVKGELYRDFGVLPVVTTELSEKVYLYTDAEAHTVPVILTPHQVDIKGKLSLEAPEGWKISPASIDFEVGEQLVAQKFDFQITPPEAAAEGNLIAKVEIEGIASTSSMVEIDYDHIRPQLLFPQSSAKVVRTNLSRKIDKVGYIMGSGDEVPDNLRSVGYQVELIPSEAIGTVDLSAYQTIIVGIRAYNTEKALAENQSFLMDFVKNGGNLIVQYNTNRGLVIPEVGPYPMRISRKRVTKEEAKVSYVVPQHPALTTPNLLGDKDFDNWVQERGLYFADQWDEAYQPILSWHDPGEEPQEGGLLIAQHGKGYFIYTGISFFRQLPAGVPGAYRLLANLIAYGK